MKRYESLTSDERVTLQKDLINWVNSFWLKARATKLPTFKQASKKFNISMKDIEIVVADCGLMYNVAIGNGNGYADLATREWTIEPSDDVAERFFNILYGNVVACTDSAIACKGQIINRVGCVRDPIGTKPCR